MVTKPVPSKVALLMSAAGLGFSLPALGVAHGETCTRPPIEADASAHAAVHSDCLRLARDGQTTHRLSTAEVLATTHDEAAVDDAARGLDLRWSSAGFDGGGAVASRPAARTRAGANAPPGTGGSSPGPTPGQNGDLPVLGRRTDVPEVEAKSAARLSEGDVHHDDDAKAASLVPMADTPVQTHWQGSKPPRPSGGPAGELLALPRKEPDSSQQASSPGPLGLRADRSESPQPVPASPVERVLNDLARIVDSRTDELALSGDAISTQAESHRDGTANVFDNPAGEATLWVPSTFGAEIVVATHLDRVLMSLDALLSEEASSWERIEAQPRQTLVASQSEKVLETLALFKKSAAQRRTEGVDDERSVAQFAGAAEAPPSPRRPRVVEHALALSGDRLDEVRGGFVGENGLRISFGIERAIYLNGSLVATNSLNVADLSKITGGQAQVTSSSTGALALIQSGQGVSFQPSAITQTAGGIVIQNALDNQSIQSITRINAVVNSSGIIRSMNLQSSMRSAVIDSLRR